MAAPVFPEIDDADFEELGEAFARESWNRRLRDRLADQAAIEPNSVQVGGSHYKTMTIQPWDAMQAWLTPEEFRGFLKGNAIKYLARANRKGGAEDVQKAHHYLEKLKSIDA